MAELMRDTVKGLGHRLADALLAIGDHAGDRHRQGPAHLVDQTRQVRGRGRQEALGQEDLAGEAVAEDPEDFVADIGLQAVDGQDDAALRAEQRLQPPGIGRGQSPQLIVAVQEVGDGALGEDDPPAGEFAVDLGDTAVLGIELENFLDFLLIFRLSEVSGSSFRRTWVTCECFAVPASARPACLAPLAVV